MIFEVKPIPPGTVKCCLVGCGKKVKHTPVLCVGKYYFCSGVHAKGYASGGKVERKA